METKLATSGKLLPGFQALVRQPETGEALPTGQIGEILVRGHTASGYLGSSAATAGAFNADGYYHTGDLGSVDEQGYVRATGRINVSPAEELISTHPAVREAHVVGRVAGESDELVIAYVVADGLTEHDVHTHVRANAASFKVPAEVHFLTAEEVPRTASGKVAKATLRTCVV